MEKLLPQNIEAECGVLGSIIIDPDAIVHIADFLSVEDFYRDAHRTIYEIILQLYEQREPADFITICDELERRNKLEEVGGASYITSLINQVPTSGNIEHYGRIVQRTAILRRLIHAAGEIAATAYDEGDATVALDKAEKLIFGISQNHARSDFSVIRDLLTDYMAKLDRLHERRGTIVGVPTGFTDLDRMTGGLQKSDLIILAARPAVGKTSFCLSLAHNAAVQHKQSIALFSLEMSKEQLVQRLLSMDAMIDQQRLRTGWIEDDEWERIVMAMENLSEANIWIDDTAGISTMEMRSKARRLKAEHGIDMIIVDYLQLMQSSAGKRNDNRVQEISEISRNLKGLARELDVPVMALAQLSRAVESRQSKVPQLSDLRESGCLTGETLVYLPEEGIYKRIDTLVGQTGFKVLALDPTTLKLEPQPVTNAFSTGNKPVFKLITRSGRTIRATANHKFLTVHGWKRLDSLAQAEHIALPRVLPNTMHTTTMSNEELALLGHLIGDGCTLPKHAIQYTTVDKDLATLVSSLATQIFGEKVNPRIVYDTPATRKGGWYQVFLPAGYALTHKKHNPIQEWMHNMGVYGLRSYEKRVPDCVFSQSEEQVGCFLRHLWSTDGHASYSSGSGKKAMPRIYYATSSEQLAFDVQSLLLRCAINARIKSVSQGSKGRMQYHVILSGKPDIESFVNKIGVVGQRKQNMLTTIQNYLLETVDNTNKDVIPSHCWKLHVVPAMAVSTITTRQMQAGLEMSYCGTALYKHGISRARAMRVANVVKSQALLSLAQSDVYWDKIVSIEPDGEEDVYDLTVDVHHNFIANQIIVHNSIEQDADIVMFIYRDEVYNPETERKGIADIILAKHRNGPVGEVSLYFQASQTRFRDLEVSPPVDE